jgi:uncharacterized membrane protein YhaH (DUF805 family)
MEWYLMAWRKFAQFDGRSRRKEYWMFTLFNVLAILALGAIAIAGGALLATRGTEASGDSSSFLFTFMFIPIGIYGLAITIPSLAAATRRFHDIGKSGWLLFLLIALGVIPVVGFITAIIQIVFLCQDSVPGANQYGPNPKFPEQGAMMYAGIPPGAIPAGFVMPPQPPPIAGPGLHYCGKCGAALKDGAAFCTGCGAHS